MRAAASGLPLMFVEASIVAREVTILDRVTLTVTSGAPTILIGPNGSGKTTLLRAAMGLTPLSNGRITGGGRNTETPSKSAIMFQRPTMLRRTNTHATATKASAIANPMLSRVSGRRFGRRALSVNSFDCGKL